MQNLEVHAGDKVYSLVDGHGIVDKVDHNSIQVTHNSQIVFYKLDGRHYNSRENALRMLYFGKPNFEKVSDAPFKPMLSPGDVISFHVLTPERHLVFHGVGVVSREADTRIHLTAGVMHGPVSGLKHINGVNKGSGLSVFRDGEKVKLRGGFGSNALFND